MIDEAAAGLNPKASLGLMPKLIDASKKLFGSVGGTRFLRRSANYR